MATKLGNDSGVLPTWKRTRSQPSDFSKIGDQCDDRKVFTSAVADLEAANFGCVQSEERTYRHSCRVCNSTYNLLSFLHFQVPWRCCECRRDDSCHFCRYSTFISDCIEGTRQNANLPCQRDYSLPHSIAKGAAEDSDRRIGIFIDQARDTGAFQSTSSL